MARPIRKTVREVPLAEVKDDFSRYLKEAAAREIVITRHGKPDVLTIADIPDPRPAPDTAVVRVVAASINPSDVKNVAGAMEQTTLPRTPGRDFAGIVEAVARRLGEEGARLVLARAGQIVLRNGLELLGISAPERM